MNPVPGDGKWLDAFDSFAAYLNRSCARTPGRGNHFLILLEFDEAPELQTLSGFFRELPDLPPILFGKIRRFPSLAPYRVPGRPRPIPVSGASDSETPEDFANEPLTPGVPFDCRRFPHALAFRFSHLFFDGCGAERFLLKLFTDGVGPDHPSGLLDSSHMNDWATQRAAGTEFRNRLLSPELPPVAWLRAPDHGRNAFFTASIPAESLLARSEREAGPFMTIPFFQYLSVSALLPLLRSMGKHGDVMIPMTVDRRGQEDHPADALFFNHWSMMPVRVSCPSDAMPPLSAFRKAFYQANAEKRAQMFRMASFPGRFVPGPVMHLLEELYGPRLGGTFLFSLLEESGLTGKNVLGRPVRNLRHLPLMPPRPGLGIIFNRSGSSMNLTVSLRSGLFPEEKAREFFHNLLTELNGK